MKRIRFPLMVVFISFTAGTSSCYTFQGNRIAPEIETVTINFFPNQTNFVATSLSQTFTETLKDKFASETRLYLKDRGGDWEFSGAITQYASTPIAPTGNETTALNRLTIAVKVEFLNNKNEKENWSQTFSRFEDYPSTQSLSTVENDLILSISSQLANDIYLRSASDW